MVDTISMVDKLFADLKKIGGVEASIAASCDGLLIRRNMSKEKLLSSLAAMSATMLGAAETATTQVERGLPARVIVESEYGRFDNCRRMTKSAFDYSCKFGFFIGFNPDRT